MEPENPPLAASPTEDNKRTVQDQQIIGSFYINLKPSSPEGSSATDAYFTDPTGVSRYPNYGGVEPLYQFTQYEQDCIDTFLSENEKSEDSDLDSEGYHWVR